MTANEPTPVTPPAELPLSALALIGANCFPLLGVIAFQWTVFSIVLLYWCENVVIGVFNILRIAVARPRDLATNASKLFLIPFFTFHYGIFTVVHGVFVFTLFGPQGIGIGPAQLVATVRDTGVWYGVLAIVLSHGFSFLHNYLGSGEFRHASPQQLMHQPYSRIVVLHITILAGGFAAMKLGSPVGALIVLICLKTAIDLAAHYAERRKLGSADPG